MNRRKLSWPVVSWLVLLAGAWWFMVAGFARSISGGIFTTALPLLLIAGGILWMLTSLRGHLAGNLAASWALVGAGAVLFAQVVLPGWPVIRLGWSLIPGLAGAAILFENQRGSGWRYTNRQAGVLIAASAGLFLVSTAIWLPQILWRQFLALADLTIPTEWLKTILLR